MKWAHDLSGIPFPTDDPIVEAVRSASKRVLGTRPLSRKEPISPTLGHEIVKKSNLENPVVLHPLRGLLPKKKASTYNLRNRTSQYPKVNTDRFKNSYINRLIFKYNLAM